MKERRIWASPTTITPWQHKTVCYKMNQGTVLRNIAIRIESNPSGLIKPRIFSENEPDDFTAVSVKREFEFTSKEYMDDGTASVDVANYKPISSVSQTEARTQNVNLLEGAYSAVETSYELLTPASKIGTVTQDSSVLQRGFLAVKNSHAVLNRASETEVTTQVANLSQETYSTAKTDHEVPIPVSGTEVLMQDANLVERAYSVLETSNGTLTVIGETEVGVQHLSSAGVITAPQTNGILSGELLGCVPSISVIVKQEELNGVNEIAAVEYQGISSSQEETTHYSTTILNSRLDGCFPHMRLTIKSNESNEELAEEMNVEPQGVNSFVGKVICDPVCVLDSVLEHHPPFDMSIVKQENLEQEIMKVGEVQTLDSSMQKISYPIVSSRGLNSCLPSVRLAAEGENSVEGTTVKSEIRTEDASFLQGKDVSLSSNVVKDKICSHMPFSNNTINQNFDGIIEIRSGGKISPHEKSVFCVGSISSCGSDSHVPHPEMVVNQKCDKQAKIRSQEKVNSSLNSGRNCCVSQPRFTLEQKLIKLTDIKSQNTICSPMNVVSYSNNFSNQHVPFKNVSVRQEETSKEANTTPDQKKYLLLASPLQKERFYNKSVPTKVLSKCNKSNADKSLHVPKTPILQDDEIGFSKMPVAFLNEPNMDIAKIPFSLTSSEGLLRDVVFVMPENAIPIITDAVPSALPKNLVSVCGIPEMFIPIRNNNVASEAPESNKSVTTENLISNVPDNSTTLVHEWTMCSRCSNPFQSPPMSKKLTIFRSDEPPGLCKHCCARLKRANYLYSHMNKITCRGIWSPSTKRTKR